MVTLEFPKTPRGLLGCSIAVKRSALFSTAIALAWGGGLAHAKTENTSTWSAHNRYVALNLGQQQQNYCDLDTQGLTTNGNRNTETGGRHHRGAATSWQTDNGWLLGFDAQRQTGATAYNGYLQAGNVATQYSAYVGYGLNVITWGVPVATHSLPDHF